jgi:RNase P subunit RPR2
MNHMQSDQNRPNQTGSKIRWISLKFKVNLKRKKRALITDKCKTLVAGYIMQKKEQSLHTFSLEQCTRLGTPTDFHADS